MARRRKRNKDKKQPSQRPDGGAPDSEPDADGEDAGDEGVDPEGDGAENSGGEEPTPAAAPAAAEEPRPEVAAAGVAAAGVAAAEGVPEPAPVGSPVAATSSVGSLTSAAAPASAATAAAGDDSLVLKLLRYGGALASLVCVGVSFVPGQSWRETWMWPAIAAGVVAFLGKWAQLRRSGSCAAAPQEAAKDAPGAASEGGALPDEDAEPLVGPGWLGGFAEEFRTAGAGVFLLVVLAGLLYAITFRVPFLFDDAPVVTRNPKMWTWEGLGQLHEPFTRTLTYWTFVVNFKLAHGDVVPSEPYSINDWWSYHLVSILLHAANGALLFLILRGLLRARPGEVPRGMTHWVALIGAAAWVAHPANTMAVAYIAQRFTLLGTLFFFGSLLTYVRLRHRLEAGESALEPGNLGRLALCYFLALCCCFCKENTTVIPAALLLVELFFFRGRRWYLPGALIGVFALGLVLGILWKGPNAFFPATSPTASSRTDYFLTQVPVLLRYLRLQLLPTDLTVEQAWPILFQWKSGFMEAYPSKFLVAVGALGHGLIFALAASLLLRGHRFIPFAIAFYYLGNLVESSVIPILDPMVDHRMYLPSAMFGTALAVAVARGLPLLERRYPACRERAALAGLALVALLGAGTVARNETWTDPIGVWEDTVQKRPDCARAYSSLGMEHLYKGQWVEAIPPIETALRLGPYHVEGWNNVGKAYLELELLEQAKHALEQGIRVHGVVPSPSVIYCYNNLGLVHLKLAEKITERTTDQARVDLRQHWLRASSLLIKAIEISPTYDTAYLNLATSEFNLMQLEQDPERKRRHAEGCIRALDGGERVRVLKGSSLSLPMLRWRLIAHSEAGQLDLCVRRGLELLQAMGDRQEFTAAKIEVTHELGQFVAEGLRTGHPAAPAGAQQVLPLLHGLTRGQPEESPTVALTIGLIQARLGQRDEAIRFLRIALERRPDDPRAPRARALLERVLRGESDAPPPPGPGPAPTPGPSQPPGPVGPMPPPR